MLTDRMPTWVKLLHTAFVCVLVPAYWVHHGPINFLWFSDIALFASVIALWFPSAFVASMQAVAVVALESVWIVGFFLRLATGYEPTGLSSYMFDPTIPLWIRGLSLFHLWLPLLLLWMVYIYGYDRRGWVAQSMAAAVILPLSYWLSDPEQNVNWVFGFGDQPQTWLPPPLFVLLLMAAYPLCVYWPSHLVLQALMPRRA